MKKLLAACAALTLLSSCSGGDDDGMTVGLSYVPDVQFFPFYVAVDQGFFEDAGVDVTLRHHGAQEPLFTALATGEEDIVFAGGDEVMFARAEGVDAKNFATFYQTYPVTLIVPADSDIESPADLEGKSVGIPGEYGENYFGLLAMIDAYGLEDVTVDAIGFTQMAALVRGDVDAVIGFVNNDAVAMAAQGFAVRTIDLAPDLPLIGPGLAALTSSFDENSDAYRAIIDGVETALDYAEASPEETLDIVTGYVPGLSDPQAREAAALTLEATLPLYRGDATLGAQDVQRWADMNEFMSRIGILSAPVQAEEAMTTEIVR